MGKILSGRSTTGDTLLIRTGEAPSPTRARPIASRDGHRRDAADGMEQLEQVRLPH